MKIAAARGFRAAVACALLCGGSALAVEGGWVDARDQAVGLVWDGSAVCTGTLIRPAVTARAARTSRASRSGAATSASSASPPAR